MYHQLDSQVHPDLGMQVRSVSKDVVDDISALCLFSILCFGLKIPYPYKTGYGYCNMYNSSSGLLSLICSDKIDTSEIQYLDVHTLAFSESGFHFTESDLCNIKFKHLILKGLKFIMNGCVDKLKKCSSRHQSVTIYNCENINEWNWQYLNFDHLYIERSDLSINSIPNGKHLPSRLKSLSYVSCLIKNLPEDYFQTLTALETLTISRNSLKKLDISAFPDSGLTSLWLLDLSYNQITSIDDSLMKYFPNLLEINLKSNQIQILDRKPFIDIWSNIRILDFTANALICDRLCWTIDLCARAFPKIFGGNECFDRAFGVNSIMRLPFLDASIIGCDHKSSGNAVQIVPGKFTH